VQLATGKLRGWGGVSLPRWVGAMVPLRAALTAACLELSLLASIESVRAMIG